MNRFEEKLDEQNEKIIEVQSKTVTQNNALQKLVIKCNDNEQYKNIIFVRAYVPMVLNIMEIMMLML